MLAERQPRTSLVRASLGVALGVALLALACQDSLTPPTGSGVGALGLLPKVEQAMADSVAQAGPARVSGPPIRYPSLLRDAGIEGAVVLEFTVRADGTVDPQSLRVVDSSNRAFEKPAADAIRGSRFRPATQNGAPVATTTVLTVRFRLARPGEAAPPADGITVVATTAGATSAVKWVQVVPTTAPSPPR